MEKKARSNTSTISLVSDGVVTKIEKKYTRKKIKTLSNVTIQKIITKISKKINLYCLYLSTFGLRSIRLIFSFSC